MAARTLNHMIVRSPWASVEFWKKTGVFVLALIWIGMGDVPAYGADAQRAAVLRARYAELKNELDRSPFARPLHMESREGSGTVMGEIYARMDYPVATVNTVLNNPNNWCDILILHLNVKYCGASKTNQGDVLNVSIGKKYDQPLADAHQVAFAFGVVTQTADYLQVKLNAGEGPLSTRDYRIALEAVALANAQTFIHLSYSYGYGLAGQLAMQVYLNTIGSNKVGFTVVGRQPDGQPLYVRGVRGVVERNTMRYYLAIEAYLGALSTPPQARVEKSLRNWFAAIERYPRQLHELEQDEYLAMKRKEYVRQQSDAQAISRRAPER